VSKHRRDIFNPSYWRERHAKYKREPHKRIYNCKLETWQAIEKKHKDILAEVIHKETSILDIGCAWGRMLDLMPAKWCGFYTGIDLCEEFVKEAQDLHPEFFFKNMDVRNMTAVTLENKYDVGLLVSIKQMIISNEGQEVWLQIYNKIKTLCKCVLYLEYDPADMGVIDLIDLIDDNPKIKGIL